MRVFVSVVKMSLVVFCVTLQGIAFSQEKKSIQFKSGAYVPEKNVEAFIQQPDFVATELVNNRYYRLIQFENIPTTAEKEELKKAGIELLLYVPQHAFYASIDKNAQLQQLVSKKAVSVIPVKPEFKLNAVLKSKQYPAWAMVNETTIEINAMYYATLSRQQILQKMRNLGLEVTMSNDAHIVRFKIDVANLDAMYAQPEFYYFEEIDKPGEPEGIEDRTDHRSNTISSEMLGGLKFDGTSVTVMLQDNSALDEHIDYTGRFFNDASAAQTGDHGEHCGGIIAGAGNLDPKGRGMAYGADVLVYSASDNNYNDVPTLVATSNLTITSKSYSNGTNAGYTTLAAQLDQQSRQMPELVHVFSAGNAGSAFFTITGGHKQAKDVIAVANLSYTDVVASSSSRGPAQDGRLKPDISAVGTNVYSTMDPNGYQNLSGTSMACPAVAGVFAQLYHAYKVAHTGANPNAALIKAAVLNTGDEVGNAGPDYIYGWGRINARRAYALINNNQYLSATVAQGASNMHNINVPVGTAEVRVMVYWTDYEAAASANPALVNDLNMQVLDPGATTYDPWVLNPLTPSALAVPGVDNLNNMEQVTITNPLPGVHTVTVDGFAVPQGPQEYYLVYEFIQDEVVLTYPIGREGLEPGVVETIRWDSYGGSGSFLLEYSIDSGATWNTINNAVQATQRYYDWAIPTAVTGNALVKITRGVLVDMSDEVFSIMDVPTNLTIDFACPDSIKMSWTAVPGATSYEISMLGNKYMDSVGVSTTTSFVFYNTNPTNTYWFSVRALGPTNARGERAIAIQKAPGIINCPINLDAEVTELSPVDNAQFLSCLTPDVDVSISVHNSGQSILTNVPVHYQVNGGTPVDEIFAGPLNPGATAVHAFATPIVPVNGINTLLIWSDISGDGNLYNDTVSSQFSFYSGAPLTLPLSEDFESFTLCGETSNCELEICLLANNFLNETNGLVDEIDWRTDEDGTPTNSSGPDADYNPGTTTGNYLYLEASGGCQSQEAHLISPCIDLTSALAPAMRFAHHLYGDDMGYLHVDVYANGTWTNDVFMIGGNQGDVWETSLVLLAAFNGNIINIRFRGVTGSSGSQSDMAIDDILVAEGLGMSENTNAEFMLYPNPAQNQLTIAGLTGGMVNTVQVYNAMGQEVLQKNNVNAQGSYVMDIHTLSAGAYMVKVGGVNGVQVLRFVKK